MRTNVTEKLALQQSIDQSGTVAHGQPLLTHRADLVDGAGHELFANARRTHEENIGVMAGHLAGEIENFQHGGALSNDAVKFQILKELLFQGPDAPALVVERRNVIECSLQA